MSDRETELAIARLRASKHEPGVRVLGWHPPRPPRPEPGWWRVRAVWASGAVMLFSVTAPDEDTAKARVREMVRRADAAVHVAPEVPLAARGGAA